MEKEKLKNMVILKNLPSNVVEEAIVVLKPNVKLRKIAETDETTDSKRKNINSKTNVNKARSRKDYIINEAEMVISNYISKLEKSNKEKYKIDKKVKNECKKFKLTSIILGGLLILSLFM